VRPVNLLPQRYRPAQASGSARGSAYAVLAGLALLLVCVVALAVTLRQISSDRAESAALKTETTAAEGRAAELGDFGALAAAKQARMGSVRQAASARLDWERLVRELAHVLPSGVWLSSVEASGAGKAGASTAATPATGAPTASGATGPSLELVGCAPDHRAVAATLVRLRRLHRAEDVRLAASGRTAADAAPTSAGSGVAGCGRGNEWSASVRFSPEPASAAPAGDPDGVPPSLGGGS
jgi:Tfp pilus assembly protein PilN